MKTAVSLPDDLFRMAEGVARRLKVSRSQLYATALADLQRSSAGNVTGQLNSVDARRSASDPGPQSVEPRSVDSDRW